MPRETLLSDLLSEPFSVRCRRISLLLCLIMAGCTQATPPKHFPVPEIEENVGTGVILNESISVSQRPARMVRVMSVPRQPQEGGQENVSSSDKRIVQGEQERQREKGNSPQSLFSDGQKSLSEPISGKNAEPAAPHALAYTSDPLPEENLLDQMDVYALSPHAASLALPRMVSREYAQLARRGAVYMPAPEEWQRIIRKASEQYGLDPRLVEAVIRVESNFDTAAESPKGAQGPMQLMPETQTYLGVVDPFDPEANVTAGSDYLRQQLDRFGSLELALAAYNAGPGNVIRYGGIPPFPETQAYVSKVLEFYYAGSHQ